MNFWRQHKDIICFIAVGVVIIGLLVCIRGAVNNNEGLVIVIVTTALVLTTMYYSLLNKRLLAATDLPKVILAIRPWNTGKKQYVFVIENVGTGIASDIELKMLGNHPLMLDNLELDLMAACAAIKPIPPKQDYKLLIETEGWKPQDRKTSFDIEVSYTNSQGRKLPPEQFSLSIEASRHYLQGDLVAERLGEIVDHIKIKKITDQSSAPKDNSNQSSDADKAKSNTPTIDDQKEQENLEKEEMSKAQSP